MFRRPRVVVGLDLDLVGGVRPQLADGEATGGQLEVVGDQRPMEVLENEIFVTFFLTEKCDKTVGQKG